VADTILHLENALSPDGVSREPLDSSDDAKLLEGLREGTEEAYEMLIARFQQPVYNLACRLMADPGEAGDVVQEVFLKVFRKVHTFRGDSSLKTWVYRIAVNEAHNQQRWFSRHRRQEIGLETDEEGGAPYCKGLCDTGRSPYEFAADREQHTLIEEALSRLNPSFREAVVLRDIEELSYEEIAEILQIALGTVKSRILRGREALRKDLVDRLEPGPTLSWTPQPVE
jgi:RNA polymerase sigma-70 factor (ECF subfamily)